jgi:hypothetical protein
MSFIPLYKVVHLFMFFASLLLMVFLRAAIIMKYRGCEVRVLAAIWGTMFQLVISPFSCINRVMEDVGDKVGQILNEEASRNRAVEGQDDQGEDEATINRLAKNTCGYLLKQQRKNGGAR